MQPIVDRLLAKSPQDRYPDAASVIVALMEVRATLPAAELAA
jgi:hypothetical protein